MLLVSATPSIAADTMIVYSQQPHIAIDAINDAGDRHQW
jgi:hypothetical protein